jgi:two-component system NarL family response regulator
MTDSTLVRVVIVDGHSLSRQAMRTALEDTEDLDIVGEASIAGDALALCKRAHPEVVIINTEADTKEGLRATESISRSIPACQVLILTDDEDQNLLLKAVQAGASGYLSHESPLSDLIAAVRALYRGETLIPPRMLRGLLKSLVYRQRDQDEAMRKLARLTSREREVLRILAAGGNNNKIAETLFISPQTARTHIRNLLIKLELHSRLEAAAFATRIGLLENVSPGQEPKPPPIGLSTLV